MGILGALACHLPHPHRSKLALGAREEWSAFIGPTASSAERMFNLDQLDGG